MDFDVYMANKSKVQRNRRKSVSPQRISRSARPSPILTNLKSKSHSPLHHTPTKTERVRQQKSFKMFLPSEKQFV